MAVGYTKDNREVILKYRATFLDLKNNNKLEDPLLISVQST